jgi:hypothetical protein
MTRHVTVVTALAALVLAAAPASAQAPPELGTWVGGYRDSGHRVAMRIVLTRLQIGKRAGTTRYRSSGFTCRGRLRLRARTAAGFVLRDRLVSGPRRRCTDGDTVIVRVINGKLRTKVRNGRSVLRVTLIRG